MAAATFGIGLASVSTIIGIAAIAARWSAIRRWWYGRVRRGAARYDLRRIFEVELARINAIQDRRKLYPAILDLVRRFTEADSFSLLARNGDGQRFVLKESFGERPISFQVGDIAPFLTWLAARGRAVTRRNLVERPDCAEAKTCGLQFCVQFLAEACLPCFLGGEMVAVINMGPTKRAGGFDAALLDLLDLLSGQFAMAIHNASMYEDLAKRNGQLEELGRLKSQLLANVSHEFRTPLASILGWSDLLLEDTETPLSAAHREQCRRIREAGRRLLDTVSTLVDLSKLEANHLALDVRRLSLKKLLEEASEPLTPGPQLTLRLDVGDDVPPVYGDSEWLRRVFYHLLANAVKYTPAGEIWVDVARAGEMVRVGVHDTGIGIAREQHSAIFFPFVQASGGADRPYEGNGLGLVISRKVIELHGGRIWLTSAPGRGSHFFFTLPMKPTTIRAMELRHAAAMSGH
ncbi:MAG: GAF domain-containing protein [Deltaproteobacteria bacterium]|nr:GAF domain-containing protein [Deltaproteobacteria bacterium]